MFAIDADWLTAKNALRVIVTVGFLFFLKYLQDRSVRVRRAANLQVHAAKKFKQRNEKRAQIHALLTKGDQYTLPTPQRAEFLLSLSASELHRHMHELHDVSCVEVVLLYALRAMAADVQLSAVTEEFTLEALEEAARVDARIAARKSGEDRSTPGVLEGIPISVKDQFDQKGADSSCGFAARCFSPLQEDGLLVSLLRDAGAIPFVRTNVPQGLMVPESMNTIWGAAANPWDTDRTPGGSSGGEAALLAARGSVLGVGSDIGGSLRIPSHFCGIYCLKPTPWRLSLDGMAIPCVGHVSGQVAIRPVVGPMGHSVDDLIRIMRAWLTPRMFDEDPFIPRVPLNMDAINGITAPSSADAAAVSVSSSSSDATVAASAAAPRKLKIGYYETDGWFEPAPACSRAVRQAVAALQDLGHTCVRWTPPNVPLAVRAYYGIMSADSAQGVLQGLEGEEVHENYKQLLLMLQIPNVVKSVAIRVLRAWGHLRPALMLQAISSKSTEQLYAYHVLLQQYIETFTGAWKDAGLDAVIAPGLGLPALKHGGSKQLTIACSYTFLYNVLHYPVGVVPIARTEEFETKWDGSSSTTTSSGSEAAENMAGEERRSRGGGGLRDLFTPYAEATVQGSAGLPVGVQVAALPWQDETVLRVMKDLERTIHFQDRPALAREINISAAAAAAPASGENARKGVEK